MTAAVAGTPGASPSSSTESRVTAATTMCGPASISTSAITPSTSTERTTPAKRLRADSFVPVGGRYSAVVTSGIYAARCTTEDASELYYRQFTVNDNQTFEIAIR